MKFKCLNCGAMWDNDDYEINSTYPICEHCNTNIHVRECADSLPSSGEIRNFDTGSRRDMAENKGRFDLLDLDIIGRDAVHLERGAKKYDDNNWKLGQPVSVAIDSALRHIMKYKAGYNDEDHLAAARWNLGIIMWFEKNKPEMQNIPERMGLENKFEYKNTNL